MSAFDSDPIVAALNAFPEFSETADSDEIQSAMVLGPYIFFEDHFCPYLVSLEGTSMLKRAGRMIEDFASSDDDDIRNLVDIGILGHLVNYAAPTIAPYLGENSYTILECAKDSTRAEAIDPWLKLIPKPTKSGARRRR